MMNVLHDHFVEKWFRRFSSLGNFPFGVVPEASPRSKTYFAQMVEQLETYRTAPTVPVELSTSPHRS